MDVPMSKAPHHERDNEGRDGGCYYTISQFATHSFTPVEMSPTSGLSFTVPLVK